MPAKAPDFFYYFTDKEIKIGSLVKINFKEKETIGYVYALENLTQKRSLLKETKLSLKPIIEIINPSPPLTQLQLKLAFWLKNYANLSLATALSMFIPYKSFLKINQPSIINHNLKKKKFGLEYQTEITINNLKNKKILIIVPQKSYLKFLSNQLQPDFIISNTIPQDKIFPLFTAITNEEKKIFLGTKNAIFLPWQNLDELIIYEEGSYFYKEFFKPPYFDYRKIFLKFAQLHKIKYLAIDSLPSFNLLKNLNLKPKLKINFEKINEIEFLEKLKEHKTNLIFVPEKTLAQRVMCEKCFQSLHCSRCQQNLTYEGNSLSCRFCLKTYQFPQNCPFCHQKTNFMIKGKSAEIVFKEIKNYFPNVFFLDKERPTIIKNFLKLEKSILIGSLYLLNPQLQAEAFFFFNFDKFYLNHSLFQRELFFRILIFFQKKVKKIYLVSQVINPLIEEKIKNGTLIDDLLEERKINKLPPYQRLIVIKQGNKDLNLLQQKLITLRKFLENKEPNLNIIGPIFSHPSKIRKRFFLELILRSEENLDFNLKKILENLDFETVDIDSYSF
ncbi:MAG: hypothetical protein KatS3mg093_358 [Candidatus Parcubacteria bacterium]|nr:MAG: hypothetical protein KatS3mg093_358 [Candidatus Parcubacteria bacterium]